MLLKKGMKLAQSAQSAGKKVENDITENGATKKLRRSTFKIILEKSRKRRNNMPRKPTIVIFVIVKLD